MDAGGDFVVVWIGSGQYGSGLDVFGQLFNSGGISIGAEFQVNTYTSDTQFYPTVAMNGGGGFVVVWSSREQDGPGSGVFGQMFNRAGNPIGAEFQVNTYTTGYQYLPAVARSVAGEFVVVWDGSYGKDGSSFGVFGQMFNSGGSPVGAEFQVNTYTTGYQYRAAVATNADGDFVVVWTSLGQDRSGDLKCQGQLPASHLCRSTQCLVSAYDLANGSSQERSGGPALVLLGVAARNPRSVRENPAARV